VAAAWNAAHLKLFLRGGAVFYVQDRSLTSAEPHFFIVLNHSPLTEEYLLLVVSSSQLEGVKRRFSHLPAQTLVEIAPEAYADFTKPSIINCNHVFRRTKAQLIEQLNVGGSPRNVTSLLNCYNDSEPASLRARWLRMRSRRNCNRILTSGSPRTRSARRSPAFSHAAP